MATTDELAARLCAAAGLEPPTSVQRAALSSANEHFLVDGTFVLRRYRQRAAPHTALVRVRRELRALETLATAGVPVTRVLAACEEPGAESLLVERAKGESLRSWAARLPLDEAASAWAAAGHALAAVHSVDVGRPADEASRGTWHYEEVLANLDRLRESRPDLPALDRLLALVEDARPFCEEAPVAFCQCDAHLWQFMLVRRGTDWECTAILDWEHAELAALHALPHRTRRVDPRRPCARTRVAG